MEKIGEKIVEKNIEKIVQNSWKNRGEKWGKIVEFFLLSQLKEYTLAIEIPPPIVPPSNKYRSLRTPLITVGTQPKPRAP